MKKLYDTCSNQIITAGVQRLAVVKSYLFLLVISNLIANTSTAQIVVTQNSNTQALAQLLAGTGVSISNWTKTCANNGTGTFTNTSSNLGVPGGIILATGNATSVPNPASSFASTQFTNNGDAQLSTLTTGTIYDKCVLEFDIVPQGPILKFDYVFASEEYPEWVCSQYNDVFGFFISGPNPGGGNYTNSNIAIIPNTTLPVAINTVNGGAPGANAGGGTCNGANQSLGYSSYYRHNLTPVNPNIVYDGMTTVLSAITPVTPCQTYHLKIAIADVADRIYDSGVFLQAYSFTSNPISVSAVSALDYAGFSSAYEGCVGGTFTLTLNQPQLTDVYATVVISGTATNGVDYTAIPTTVMFPAGTTTLNIDLNALADGITEPAENVTIAVLDPCTGIVSSSATITIRDDIPPTITVSDSTLCLGQSTQMIANGGVSYSWSPAAGLSSTTVKNPIATPTVTTTYTVSMQWGSCVKTASATVYVSNPANAITAAPAGVVCNGGSVTLTASPSNGVAPYSYVWNNASNSSSIVASTGGTYTVTATDAYGCTASATRSVTISNLSITGLSTNVSCVGGNNGSVDVTVTGANAPFTYNWGGGVTSQDRTNLAAGTYTITASNTVGCSVTASYIITQPSATLTTSATNSSVNCFGGNNGSINLTVNGGVTPYTFQWSNSANTEDLNSITAGTYTVTVTDANGCTALRSVTVSQPTAIVTSSTQVNPLCNGAITGSIDLTVSGGVGPYGYGWSNGASTQDISSLSAGTYNVTVADGNGCTVSRSVNITQPGGIVINANSTNPSCFGASTGSITLTVTGGTGAYNYNWGGGITTQNRTALGAGNYSVTVTDANGCSASASVALTQPAAALTATATLTNVLCNGGSTGSISLSVSGGTPGYSFNWGGGVVTQNRTSLAAGTYTVTVTDANSCTFSTSATLTQPTLLTASNTKTDVSCNAGANGTINLTVSGGTTPYNYNWGGGITTEDRTNLSAGTYTVTATDASGCTVTTSAVITQPAALSLSHTQVNVTCNGGNNGSINVTTTGGTTPYTYNWGGGVTTEDRTLLAAGTYILTATDNAGCSATLSVSITQPSAISIAETVSNASCAVGNDGSITLSVTGGSSPYNYNWGGGITTANRTGLVAGTYTVSVTDNAGCTVSKAIAVTQIGTGISLSSSVTNIACNAGNNGAIDITVVGGTAPVTYNWGGGVTTEDRNSLTAGTYSVTVTDGLGCSAVATNLLTQPAAISLSTTITNILCYGAGTGAINLTASGGTGVMSYNWGGGITTEDRNSILAGTYSVTVTDANSCTASTTAIVSQPSAAISLSSTVANVACFGASTGGINLTASGGTSPYTYNWSNGSISEDLNSVGSNIYNVTVSDANLCTATTSATVSQPAAALSVTLTPTNPLCNGTSTGSITTAVSGGTTTYSFNWGGGVTSQNRSALAAGNYIVTVTDALSCTATATATLTQPSVITVTSVKMDVSCNGSSNGAINVTASGGMGALSFNWGGGISTEDRTGLSAGSYTVTVTDANGCTGTHTVSIIQPTQLAVTMNSGSTVCLNPTGTATAVTNNTGTAPYSYVWSNAGPNSQTLNGLPPGNVSVTVTDANNCSASGAVAVTIANNNTDANFSNTALLCGPNALVNFTHTGSSNITSHYWNFGNGATSIANNPSYTYPAVGTYTVTHIVIRGFCEDTVTRSITINAKPVLNSTNTNITCNGLVNGLIDLTATGNSPFTYNWGGGITTQDRSGLAPGNYTVTVTDANSCTSTFTASITQPTVLSVSNAITNVTCNGGTNGAINLTATGGTTGYSYNWGGGITTEDRSLLSGGVYTVTVTDANSCSVSSSITVYQPNAINIASSVVHPLCNGSSNGSITITTTGGTGTHTYNWGGGVTTQNRSSLSAATYSLTVTDANLCTATSSFTLNQPAVVSTMLTPTAVLCYGGNNGSIISSTSGGTSPYTYTWNDGNSNANRSSLAAGSYQVTVHDNNGCSTTASTAVSQPATAVSLVVNSANTLNCYGDANGAINITASGGNPTYTFSWSDGATSEDRSNILGGTYFVTATDLNGCYATISATVNQPISPVVIDTLIVNNVVCFNGATGAIQSNVSGGTSPYTYNWGGGVTSQNRLNLIAGTYSLTVTDNNGCTASSSAVVSEPALAISATTVVTDVTCFGANNGAIDLSVSNGTAPYTYLWNGGATSEDRTALSAGSYSVTVSDINNCSATASAMVNQPTPLNVSIAGTTNVSCFGGSNGTINVNAAGATPGYTYNWGGGITSQNRVNLSAGSYTVTVTDLQSCTASVSANITQPAAALSVNPTSVINVSCFGGNDGSINISATGGTTSYSYNWGGGVTSQNRTGLAAGTYTVTVTDANSCTALTSANVSQPAAALTVALSSVTNVSCLGGNNGAINITASGGTSSYTYNWGGGVTSQNRTGLAAGSYTVTVQDANACTATLSASVTQPTTSVNVVLVSAPSSCFGSSNGSITNNTSGGTGAYSYIWNDAVTTQNRTSLSSGNYSVTSTDANGCSASSSATVNQPTQLSVTSTHTDVLCNGGSTGAVDLSVSGGTSGYSYSWTNGATTQDLTTMAAGNYTVTVQDINNCTASHTIAVTEPAPLQATSINANVSCFGGSNGGVQLSVSGGVIPYIFNWSNNINSQTLNSLQAGTYSVTVQDQHNCTTTLTVNIIEPTAIVATTAVTNVSCNSGSNGAIDLSVSGGTSGYTYNWGGGITTQDRTSIPAGLYTVTVTDANNCNITASATVSQPSSVSVSSAVTNILCYGNATGAINITATGGTSPYNYNWGSGVIVEDRAGLSAGSYTVTVTDANSCSATAFSNVLQPAAPLNTTVTGVTQVGCFGATTGNISVNISGGTSPYNFLWNDNATTQNRNNLSAGTYTLTVTDANSCSTAVSATVNQPAAPLSVSIASVNNVSCFAGNNGAVSINAADGTSPYSYNWGGGITSQNRTGLVAGNYNVTVTDANSCIATASATLTQPSAALQAVVNNTTNVLCFGGNNGAINITTSGGTTSYTYLWNDAVTAEDRTTLAAGTYHLTVTDANSCTTTVSSVITQPAAPLNVSISSISNVSCFGGSNGSINISAAGGTTPYSYNWGGGIVTQNRTGLSAGVYTVSVTDGNSCSATLTATVTQPSAPLSVNVASSTNLSCFNSANGSITTTTSGGTSPYSYNWGGGISTPNRAGLAAGNYSLTVTDAQSCTAATSTTLTEPALLQVNTTPVHLLCNGASTGSISTTPSGGTSPYTYTWSNNQTTSTASSLTAGNYQVTLTDANNCSVSGSASINQPTQIVITETHYDAECNGASTGIIDITATGGVGNYAYLWSNNEVNEDLSGLPAGNYTVTVTDGNSCTATRPVTINQPSPFSISFTSINVQCNGGADGSINLTVSGATPGYTYQWTNGATTEDLNNIVAGNYNVVIHDINNCVASANVTITQPNNLVVVTNTHTNVSCFGGSNGSIDITIQGGTFPFSYGWSDGATTQDRTGLSAGTYQITVNDLNSCAISQPVNITQPSALNVTLNKTDVSCNGLSDGNIVSNVNGGVVSYTYLWSNGSNNANLNAVPASNYTLTVTDANMCIVTATTQVTQPILLSVTGVKTDVNCFGGTDGGIDLTATGGTPGYSYLWNSGNNTEDISGLSSGTYTVTVTDFKNCQSSISFSVTQPQLLSVALQASNPICNGVNSGAIDLTFSGGTGSMTFQWSNGATTEDISGLGAGNYSATVTDANGCIASGASIITMPAAITLAENHTDPLCFSGSDGGITLAVIGGTPNYVYNWSNGATTANVTGITAGSYSVTVTDGNNCQATLSAITVNEPTIIGIGVNTASVSCINGNDGSVNITVSGGTPSYTYNWSNGASSQNLSNVVAGTYNVTITDLNGCSQTATGFINTLPPMMLTANVDQLVCVQDEGSIDVTVTSGAAPYSYNWSNGSDDEDLDNINPGTYSLVVIDNNGCVLDTTFTVINLNQFSVDATGSTTLTLGETANLNAVSTGSNQTAYNWTPTFGLTCANCPFITVQPGQTTTYTVVAVDTNGCTAQDTVTVEVIADHTVFTPNAFTPNGDGNNDVFQLFGNKAGIKYLNIMIFNRWGEKIFEGTDAEFSWDGTYKGETVEPDVYVYVMKIVHLDGKTQKVFKGSLTVLR